MLLLQNKLTLPLTLLCLCVSHFLAAETQTSDASQKALNNLIEGNKRFVSNEVTQVDNFDYIRKGLKDGQQPFAIIVGCSDSRVSPEVVFDYDLGQLFVIRTAGHVVDEIALGSIEYAAQYLNTPLIIVLGHQNCGAVAATVAGKPVPGSISSIANAIEPTVLKTNSMPGDPIDNAVHGYTNAVVKQLKIARPILAEKVKNGSLMIVGGYYNLETGVVDISKDGKFGGECCH